MTNADKIRKMTNKELADFLADTDKFSACQHCDYLFKDCTCDFCNAPSGFVCVKAYASALIGRWLEETAIDSKAVNNNANHGQGG